MTEVSNVREFEKSATPELETAWESRAYGVLMIVCMAHHENWTLQVDHTPELEDAIAHFNTIRQGWEDPCIPVAVPFVWHGDMRPSPPEMRPGEQREER